MLKWFLSPEGEKLLVEDVLEKGLLSHRYPLPYLKMCAQQREWKGIASTTQLLNGTRLEYLKILTPYAVDPDDCAFMLLGTRAHNKLEKLTPKGSFAELSVPIPEDEITGIADLLEEQPNGEWWLTDYKTWGSYKVKISLGLVKKKRPMLDEDGNPVLYKRNGATYKAGDPRQEDYYEIDESQVALEDVTFQLNRYKYVIEEYFDITISKLKVFAVARDGGTMNAKGNGINGNTFYIDIPIKDIDEVKGFYAIKRDALLAAVNGYQIDDVKDIELNEYGYNTEALHKHAPMECTESECWSGRRCQGYCPVAEVCQKLGCRWLKDELD